MGKPAAERQRECRKRRASGQTVLTIPVNAGALADWLVERGELQAWDAEDRAAISAALARHLSRVTA